MNIYILIQPLHRNGDRPAHQRILLWGQMNDPHRVIHQIKIYPAPTLLLYTQALSDFTIHMCLEISHGTLVGNNRKLIVCHSLKNMISTQKSCGIQLYFAFMQIARTKLHTRPISSDNKV